MGGGVLAAAPAGGPPQRPMSGGMALLGSLKARKDCWYFALCARGWGALGSAALGTAGAVLGSALGSAAGGCTGAVGSAGPGGAGVSGSAEVLLPGVGGESNPNALRMLARALTQTANPSISSYTSSSPNSHTPSFPISKRTPST